MSISSLSSLATTAFDNARSTLKAIADAAATPTGATKTAPGPGATKTVPGTSRTAVDLSAMTQDTIEVSAARAPAEKPPPVAAEPETPARPRSRMGNSLDSYA